MRSIDDHYRVSTLESIEFKDRQKVELIDPTGIAVGQAGDIYLVDAETRRLFHRDANGTFQTLCSDRRAHPTDKESRT